MRLIVDLGEDAGAPPSAAATGATLGLHSLLAALRSPRRLQRLLRGHRYQTVEVRRGDPGLSALQAAAQLALVLARADAWTVDGRSRARFPFAASSLLTFAAALSREIWWSALATIRLVRATRRSYSLPRRSADSAARVLYLRVEPSLRWQGTQVGGAATHTQGVINGLLSNGIDVNVVAAERPAGTERAGFTAARPRRVLQLIRGLGYADYTQAVVRAASGIRADVVYQRYQLGSYAGLQLAERLGVPLVLEFNGPEIWVERHWRSGRRLLLEGPLERLERHHLREASLVVVVSMALREYVLGHGVPPERVLMNPNGVDVDELSAYRAQSPSEWRRQKGLPEVPTVGFIGTFGPWHGAQLLPALIARVPEARWLLIGGGGVFEQVQAEIDARRLSERVLLTGVLAREKALEMLACCDVCVSPHVPSADGTPFFGSPTKLFEYMGLAKPIVASDLDQIGQVIEHERSGLLCPPGDVDGAAAAVHRLLGDESLRERLGAEALRRAAVDYSWNAHVRRILSAIGVAESAASGGRVVSLTP